MRPLSLIVPPLILLVALQGGRVSADCGYPGAPAHSSVRFSGISIDDVIDEEDGPLGDPGAPLAPGTIATYTCERGFELLGPGRRQCQVNGTWTPEGVPFCVLNVAAGKAPMQSSRPGRGFYTQLPQLAVDGSTSQVYTPQTCTLTDFELKPWWYVNLLEPYMVQLVRLDFGKPCCGEGVQNSITVRVGNNRPDLGTNPICNRFTGHLKEGGPLFLPCNPPMPGAFVSVHLESDSQVPIPVQLSLCEAFVYTDQALPIERCPQFRDQPPGSTATYNGKCYIFYNRQPQNFRDALGFCRSRGGTLVDESNPALQGFISWELWRRHRNDTSSQYWMGAVRDQKDRTVWRWTGSGDEISVSFWSLPQGTEGDCARFDGRQGWLWSDTPCHTRLNYICQHQPRACGRPEQPPNSTMAVINPPTGANPSRHYEVGTTVEYTCDIGSLLIGPSNRKCLDTGFYDEFPPICKSIECGYPARIKHGGYTLINNTVNYLSQVLYECNEGFEMTGRARLTCDIDERWNGPPPRCEPVKCDSPPMVSHSQIQVDEIDIEDVSVIRTTTGNATNRNLLVGSTVIYTCDKGYRLNGNRQLVCMSSGSYDKAAPTCTIEEPPSTPAPTPKLTVRPSTRGRPYTPNRVRSTANPSAPPTSPSATTSTSTTTTTTSTQRPTQRTRQPIEQPASVHETVSKKSSIGLQKPVHTTTTERSHEGSDHPRDNEISETGVDNAHAEVGAGIQEPNEPYRIDRAGQPFHQGKLNLGAIIALGVFGGFVFLAAVITTVVILVRRNRGGSGKHYRHRASPDCNTVASFDSGSSGSRGGLNRYYRQAWENLHESATGQKVSSNSNHSALRRKDTLDEPGYRDNYRNGTGAMERDGSELVVSDVYASKSNGSAANNSDKKRHHHHHHHNHHHHHPSYQQSHHRY